MLDMAGALRTAMAMRVTSNLRINAAFPEIILKLPDSILFSSESLVLELLMP